MKTNAAISARIALKLAEGLPLPDAFDAVMGEGSYAKLAGEIYDGLRAKAVSK